MTVKRTPFRGAMARSTNQAMDLREFASYIEGKVGSGTVRNPYSSVVTVYACVRQKAAALCKLELRASDHNEEVLEDGPLVALLEQPNPKTSKRAMLRQISSWLDLRGVVYLIKRLSGNVITAMYAVSDLEMIEHRVNGELIELIYTPINGGGSERFTPEEVHIIRDPDFGSGDLNKSLSPRQAASLAISQHYQADLANDHSLRHGAGGGLGLVTQGNLTPDQRKALDSDLNQKYSGPKNRHRWMLLEGAMSVEKLFSTFAEMEFTDLKYYSREDICVAYGMNPLVLGFGGREGLGSGQHTEAAHLIVWDDTHLPRAQWIAEELCDAIIPHVQRDRSLSMRDAKRRSMTTVERRRRAYTRTRQRSLALGYRYSIWFDDTSVAIVLRSKLDLAKLAGEWIDKGVTLNNVIAAFDMPFEEQPWGDTWYKPFGLVDVQDGDAQGAPGDDDLPGPPPEEPEEPGVDEGTKTNRGFEHIERLTEPQKALLWRKWRASWAGIELTFRRAHQKLINSWRKETLANLTRLLPEGKSFTAQQRRDLIGQILFDLVLADRAADGKLGAMVTASFVLGGEQATHEAAAAEGKAPEDASPFNIKDPLVEQRIRSRKVRIRDTTRTTRRRLANSLAEGVANNESVQRLAERIRKEFNFANSRAKTVARDHVGGAVEDARHEGRRQAGTPAKSWLWSRKETGRPWHMEAEQQTLEAPIPNDEMFTLPETGARTLYPRGSGPGMTAKDTANCACTTIARYPGDRVKDARAISHYITHGFITDRQLATIRQNRKAA